MADQWTAEALRQFVGDGYVVLLDRHRQRLPLPAEFGERSVQQGDPLWDPGLAMVHAPDRIGAVRAYREAIEHPGAVQETSCRGGPTGNWGRFRLRFLNLLDHADVAAFVSVVDRFEPLDNADNTWVSVASRQREVPWVRFRCDLSATIVEADGMFEALLGLTGDRTVGRSVLDFVHPDDIPVCLEAGVALLAEPGSEVEHRHRIRRPDGTVRLVDAHMRARGIDHGTWELELRDAAAVTHNELVDALRRGQLHVVYQPLVTLDGAGAVGAEALVRWTHPRKGLIPPMEFIPVAEATGVILDIGALVLRLACTEAASWPDDRYVSVNLAAPQLADAGIVATVADTLRETGLDPARLTLEVTESALIEDPDTAIAHLGHLKDLGVRLAIDDFGTGYSSLLSLKRMPVDALKIDRCFISGLTSDPGDRAIVTSVVAMAHALGITAIGEGVESSDQWQQLAHLGCDVGQGFLFSRPVPAPTLLDLLTRWPFHRATPPAHATGAIQLSMSGADRTAMSRGSSSP